LFRREVLEEAKKDGLRIYESFDEYEEDDKVYAETATEDDDYISNYERLSDDTEEYASAIESIPSSLRPAPFAYVKDSDGAAVPLYKTTAIQEALEKAGLCLTIEQHATAIQDKLKSPRNGEIAPPNKWEASKKEREPIAAKETAFRQALYRQTREATFEPSALLRTIAILLNRRLTVSGSLQDIYGFDPTDSEKFIEFVSLTNVYQLQLTMLDLVTSSSLQLEYYNIDEKSKKPAVGAEYQAILDLAKTAGIDIDALRLEHFAPEQPKESAKTTKEKTGKAGAKAAAKTETASKAKQVARPKSPKPNKVVQASVAWPFPTSAASAEKLAADKKVKSAPADKAAVDTKTLPIPGLDTAVEEQSK
jgi:hypothetical protein